MERKLRTRPVPPMITLYQDESHGLPCIFKVAISRKSEAFIDDDVLTSEWVWSQPLALFEMPTTGGATSLCLGKYHLINESKRRTLPILELSTSRQWGHVPDMCTVEPYVDRVPIDDTSSQMSATSTTQLMNRTQIESQVDDGDARSVSAVVIETEMLEIKPQTENDTVVADDDVLDDDAEHMTEISQL